MTVHVSGRSISALLLLSVSLLGMLAELLDRQVQRVEVGVALQPSTGSGRGK